MANNFRYSDLDINMTAHPVTGDAARKYDVEAIKQSMRNLTLIKPYEIPFSPLKSSKVTAYLFEPVSPMTALALKDSLRELYANFEPRAEIVDISVYADVDDNGYEVSVVFNPVNIAQNVQLSFFLQRLR